MTSDRNHFIQRIKNYHLSFKNAFRGIATVASTQQNFKTHLVISALVLISAFLLEISRLEVLLLVVCIIFGLAAEMINTAVEALTDLITSEWKKEAKIAKDISAGMVLVVAVGTIIVGFYIFIPRLITVLLMIS